MALRTFTFTGKDSMYIEHRNVNYQLKKGEKFTTDDDSLAAALLELPDVKEVVEPSGKEEKSSRRSNAAQ